MLSIHTIRYSNRAYPSACIDSAADSKECDRICTVVASFNVRAAFLHLSILSDARVGQPRVLVAVRAENVTVGGLRSNATAIEGARVHRVSLRTGRGKLGVEGCGSTDWLGGLRPGLPQAVLLFKIKFFGVHT